MERFSKKVLAFIGTNDQQIMMMQNKVTRDLTHSERSTEDKIKQFKTFITEKTEASEAKNESSVAILQHNQDEMKNKLA